MASTPLDVNAILERRFLKKEREYLKQQPLFTATIANVEDAKNLHYVLNLAEALLKECGETSPASRQFRDNFKRQRQQPQA